MPEGPSIVILRELIDDLHLKGKKVVEVSGNTKIDKLRMLNQEVCDIRSWGKHFLICFKDFSLRVHFLLFGTYRINERKESVPRLRLNFEDAELNLYGCSVQFQEGDINDQYDWSADVMSPDWNARAALTKISDKPAMLACDALLDQNIFAGVGNAPAATFPILRSTSEIQTEGATSVQTARNYISYNTCSSVK